MKWNWIILLGTARIHSQCTSGPQHSWFTRDCREISAYFWGECSQFHQPGRVDENLLSSPWWPFCSTTPSWKQQALNWTCWPWYQTWPCAALRQFAVAVSASLHIIKHLIHCMLMLLLLSQSDAWSSCYLARERRAVSLTPRGGRSSSYVHL